MTNVNKVLVQHGAFVGQATIANFSHIPAWLREALACDSVSYDIDESEKQETPCWRVGYYREHINGRPLVRGGDFIAFDKANRKVIAKPMAA